MFDLKSKQQMVSKEQALPGRGNAMPVPALHFVTQREMLDASGELACPAGCQRALFGLGCFWGAERKFWQQEGVYLTAVGYAAGYTPHPTYEEVCSGLTGHNEVVALTFDPDVVYLRTPAFTKAREVLFCNLLVATPAPAPAR